MTATYYMIMDMVFVCIPPDNSTANFDDFTDKFMDELGNLEDADPGIVDPDLTASLTNLTASVYMGVKADSRRDAERLFVAHVRTALHAAGCYTPNWPFRPVSENLPKPREVDHAAA